MGRLYVYEGYLRVQMLTRKSSKATFREDIHAFHKNCPSSVGNSQPINSFKINFWDIGFQSQDYINSAFPIVAQKPEW